MGNCLANGFDHCKLEFCFCCMSSADRANTRRRINHRNHKARGGKPKKKSGVSKFIDKHFGAAKCSHWECQQRPEEEGGPNKVHSYKVQRTGNCGGCNGTGRHVHLVNSNSTAWNVQGPTRNTTCGSCGGSGSAQTTKTEHCQYCNSHCTLGH